MHQSAIIHAGHKKDGEMDPGAVVSTTLDHQASHHLIASNSPTPTSLVWRGVSGSPRWAQPQNREICNSRHRPWRCKVDHVKSDRSLPDILGVTGGGDDWTWLAVDELGDGDRREGQRAPDLIRTAFYLDLIPGLCGGDVRDVDVDRGSCLLQAMRCNGQAAGPVHERRGNTSMYRLLRIDVHRVQLQPGFECAL